MKPLNPKGNQSWTFTGRTDAEAEAPILWPPDAKSWHIGKDSDAGKDWRQEEKGMTEDEMAGWHHWLDGHEFEQALGNGQGSLACCTPWGHKESDKIEWLNNNKCVMTGVFERRTFRQWQTQGDNCVKTQGWEGYLQAKDRDSQMKPTLLTS